MKNNRNPKTAAARKVKPGDFKSFLRLTRAARFPLTRSKDRGRRIDL
jgi:hypothetical protein